MKERDVILVPLPQANGNLASRFSYAVDKPRNFAQSVKGSELSRLAVGNGFE